MLRTTESRLDLTDRTGSENRSQARRPRSRSRANDTLTPLSRPRYAVDRRRRRWTGSRSRISGILTFAIGTFAIAYLGVNVAGAALGWKYAALVLAAFLWIEILERVIASRP